MRTGKLLAMALIAGLASAGAATADDVVHFRNGAHLPVLSHEIKDQMVHVTLASEAQMAFPLNLVERIESGGEAVFPSPTANRAVEGAPRGTVSLDDPPAGAQRYSAAPRGSSRGSGGSTNRTVPSSPDDETHVGLSGYAPTASADSPNVDPADMVGRPFADSPDPKRRNFTVVGDQTLVPRGDTLGRKTVINTEETRKGRSFTPITIRPKALPTAPPPPPETEGSPPPSGSDGASSAEGAADSSGSEGG